MATPQRQATASSMISVQHRVQVYKNLHTGTWSVRQGGIVIDHPLELALRDCRFLVQPAGRAKVLREQRKNVHAYISGYIVPMAEAMEGFLYDVCQVSYNPYKAGHFTDPHGGCITESKYSILKHKVFVASPCYLIKNDKEET
jgi:hypothetical protein